MIYRKIRRQEMITQFHSVNVKEKRHLQNIEQGLYKSTIVKYFLQSYCGKIQIMFNLLKIWSNFKFYLKAEFHKSREFLDHIYFVDPTAHHLTCGVILRTKQVGVRMLMQSYCVDMLSFHAELLEHINSYVFTGKTVHHWFGYNIFFPDSAYVLSAQDVDAANFTLLTSSYSRNGYA